MADESSSLFPGGRRIGSANLPLGAQFYDNAGTPVLAADFSARQLKSANGTSIPIDYSSNIEISFFGGQALLNLNGYADLKGITRAGADVFDLTLRRAIDTNSSISVDWDARVLNDNNGDGVLPSIYWGTRHLIANDGSTVALDWSDPTTIAFLGGEGAGGITVNQGDFSRFGLAISAKGFVDADNSGFSSTDGNTTFNNSGFHGIGSVIAGTKTATGTATTTFTVTIGVTMANTTYKVTTEGDNALSAAVRYVTNKTTTTFDVVYLAGLTGAVSFDWMVSP